MKVPLEPISVVIVVLSCLNFADGKGGSGGGGGGGRGGGGGSRGGFGRSSHSGGNRGLSRRGGAAVILGSGAAGYAAYKAHQNFRRDRDRDRDSKDSPDFDSYEQYYGPDPDGKFDYKTQESTSYYASEGIGMSAWALVFLILGIIALGTVGWYCCNVFLPVWQDNQQMRRRSMLGSRMKDEVPLQETPSTATPSP